MDNKFIKIKGARVHNLKNINVEIPRNKLVVITGLSGSGKSSLAFDTIYAEGQRRYVESLSAYARQFIGVMDKPDIDSIEGLSPAISIDQKTGSHNPRSTVGTVTEIYDYLRLLFARIGIPHCPICGDKIKKYSIDEIIEKILEKYLNQKVLILSQIIKDKKGEHKSVLEKIARSGFSRIRFDKQILTLEEFRDMTVQKQKKHTLEVVIDTIEVLNKEDDDLLRLIESTEKALDISNGTVTISPLNKKLDIAQNQSVYTSEEKIFSREFSCPKCDISMPKLEPRNFSFNSPHGACSACSGIGTKLEIDPKLILNPALTIAQGGIKPLARSTTIGGQTWIMRAIGAVGIEYGFDLNTLVSDLTKKQLDAVLYGTKDKEYNSGDLYQSFKFEGIIPNLEKRYKQTESDYVRKEIARYMQILDCPKCMGKRLKPEILSVTIEGKSIYDISSSSIDKIKEFFVKLKNSKKLTKKDKLIADQIIKKIESRLDFLLNVGLNYLTLNRTANTLSGGESQRIRLATQIGSSLTGVIYILDEPSIGLHQRDNNKLIKTLKNLRDLGNTVIVVEHDENIMHSSDWIIDVGPKAGEYGGKIVAVGTYEQIKKNKNSYTGQYLSGVQSIKIPKKYNSGNGQILKIIGASENNLKNIDVEFPLGKLIAITGVSGSGKSTLMTSILSKALSKKFYRSKSKPGEYKAIEGISFIDKMININQSPIGRTPRSNPATYIGLFTPIRELFSSMLTAKIKGYGPGSFSFNVKGGRCETCHGDGVIKIEMQFLSDVYVECEVCHGKRYNKEILDIKYKGKNISEVLEMTVNSAINFFKNIPSIYPKLKTLQEVGLGYIKLGQSATTLSGGEAQRVKLASELSKKSTGRTLYILDEPTTGLHFKDIKKLLTVLQKLVKKGNTVLIIEHNLDVIKAVDWIIDMGPEGGDKGGEIVAVGTPKDISKNKKSYTGKYLKDIFK